MSSALIVDDHPIVRQGCRRILNGIGLDEVDEATGVAAGYRAYLRKRHTCVVTDLTFAGDDLAGLSLVKRIVDKDSTARVLVFSMHNDPAIVSHVLKSGARGYVLKDTPSSELATAVTQILAGERHISHELAIRVAVLRAKGEPSPVQALTEREREILFLLGRGNSYALVATKLGISYKTVGNVTSLLRAKLKLGSLAELIRFAMQNAR